MKKCAVFFTLLVFTLVLAVLIENKEQNVAMDEEVIGENTIENLLAEETTLSAE